MSDYLCTENATLASSLATLLSKFVPEMLKRLYNLIKS